MQDRVLGFHETSDMPRHPIHHTSGARRGANGAHASAERRPGEEPRSNKEDFMDEERRLDEPASAGWKTWGPYLSERQWGTVREDYSPGGTAWDSFSHDAARSRAYRWGEDGIAGVSDADQLLCLSRLPGAGQYRRLRP